MSSKTPAKSSEKDYSGIIANENDAENTYHCPLCFGSGLISRRMNDIAEKSVASVDGQQPEQRRSEVEAVELLWARLNDEEKREFEQKREDEKKFFPDASNAMAQSIITQSKGLRVEKERREAKIKKYVRVTASEGNELKDEKKRASKGVKEIVVKAPLEENEFDNDKQKTLSDRMKQIAENAAELREIRDEDQGLEKRMNQLMEIDGAEGLEELEIMNKFYERQINRLHDLKIRYRERKELGGRVDKAVEVDAEVGKKLKDSLKFDAYKAEELEDEESNFMDRLERLEDRKK
ncbi:uncharacterized protein EAF01_011157 [Botrytis porri]|uniref:uncharacterized protein n=1 Tax=Botrytis porri TaxID=87229 RepID=UPI0019006EDC|nr:uncharacterized protein EAF01_011157 [Botrytis porri]KAF7888003.1 hypothetical protein EAF01_011157 [Botrytis porri]